MTNKNLIKQKGHYIEVEKKFLINGELPELKHGKKIVQAYIFTNNEKELRIRISENKCLLSIKININDIEREEFEYSIPIEEGQRLINIGALKPEIEKTRYIIMHNQMRWEVDVFERDNKGLVIAELELESANQFFVKPSWVGKEVTQDRRFYNSNIYQNPYKNWKHSVTE